MNINWLRSLFPRRRFYADLYAEMAEHLEEKTDALVAAGLSRDQAARAARRAFGDVTRHEERGRAVWRSSWLEGLFADFRLAGRTLLRSPRFTALVVLTLGLGIGANTVIFSVADAVLLHPLPYRDAGRLVWLTESLPSTPDNNLSWLDMQDWKRQNHVFQDIAGYSDFSLTSNRAASPQLIPVRYVSRGYFALTGVAPQLGRTFQADEHRPGGAPVLVISHSFWKSQFGGAPGALGQTIELNHKPWTVVGIMPAGYGAISHTQLWAPFEPTASQYMTMRQFSWGMYALARLRPGVTLAQARADLGDVSRRLEQLYPKTTGGEAVLIPLPQRIRGDIKPALLLLAGAVALLLLIACANIAGLLLVKAVGRQRELALRLALGASRARLLRQIMAESVLLSLAGAGLGLGVARWGTALLVALLPAGTPFLALIAVNGKALGFALGASLITALLFGLAPALLGLGGALRASAGARPGAGGHRRVHASLVVVEVGLATALMIGAGLMARSMLSLFRVSPGFDSHGVLAESVVLDQASRLSPAQRAAAFTRVAQAASHVPGVASAAAVSLLPFSAQALQPAWDETYLALPERQPLPANPRAVHYVSASPGYFRTMGIPLIAGRAFQPSDVEGAPPVAVVDQELARRYWPDSSPVGQHIKLFVQDFNNTSKPALTIVGVVGTVKAGGLDVSQKGEVYCPAAQSPAGGMTIVVRARLAPLTLAPSVAAAIHRAAPGSPIYLTQSLDGLIAASQATRRLFLRLLVPLALGALLLSALGLYGMLSYVVSRGTSEIGLRLALGAQRADITRLVLAQGMRLALMGILVGLGAALVVTRLMASLLFAVRANDPLTCLAVAAVLAAAAGLACYLPARRAQRITPMQALRSE